MGLFINGREHLGDTYVGQLTVTDKITTTGGADLSITPDTGGITKIGAFTTSRSLNNNNDLGVQGKLEVNGKIYADGGAVLGDSQLFYNNTARGAIYPGMLSQTNFCMGFLTGNLSNTLLVCEYADRSVDFGHAAQTNPTIFIHSADATDTSQWISIAHDQTDGVIDCGTGTLNLGGTTVNFVNATRTAATVTHDAYVVLEIGGTEYKFMLGS